MPIRELITLLINEKKKETVLSTQFLNKSCQKATERYVAPWAITSFSFCKEIF